MEFLVFGSLRVLDAGRPVTVEAPRQRALVASLLVHANEGASIGRVLGLASGAIQLDPAALRYELLDSSDTHAAFRVAAAGHQSEPCPALE